MTFDLLVPQWKKNRDKIEEQGSVIMDAITKATTTKATSEGLPGNRCVQQAFESLDRKFDEEHGGFGSAPKFPQPCESLAKPGCSDVLLFGQLRSHTHAQGCCVHLHTGAIILVCSEKSFLNDLCTCSLFTGLC